VRARRPGGGHVGWLAGWLAASIFLCVVHY
jgi:hypothetical protein